MGLCRATGKFKACLANWS